MQYRLIALAVIIVTALRLVYGYVRFLKQRVAIYKLVYEFLCVVRERVGCELAPISRAFIEFCENKQVRQALPKGDFSTEARKYLLPEDGEHFFTVLSDTGGSLEMRLHRLSEAEEYFRQRFSQMKASAEKTAKIAITLYAGLSLGGILLFI